MSSTSTTLPRPPREHNHPIPEEHRLTDRVRHKHHRLLRLQPQTLQIQIQLIPTQRIQRPKRLIHQKQRRIMQKRPTNRDPLPHPPTQLKRIPVLEPLQPHQIQQLQRPSPIPPLVIPLPKLHLQQHIPQHLPPIQEHRLLKHDPQIRIRPIHLTRTNRDGPRTRTDQPRHHQHQRRLPTPRQTNHPHNSPAPISNEQSCNAKIGSARVSYNFDTPRIETATASAGSCRSRGRRSLTSPTLTSPRMPLVNVRLLLFGFFVLFINTTLLVPGASGRRREDGRLERRRACHGRLLLRGGATQLRMPHVIRRYGARRLLVTAFLLLGLPCFVYVPAKSDLGVVPSRPRCAGSASGSRR